MKRRTFLQVATAVAATTIAPKWLTSTKPSGDLSIALIQRNGDECTYRGYRRAAAPRNAATWEIHDELATNKIAIEFPECSGRDQEITGFGICINDELIFVGDLTASLHVVSGVRPSFNPGALTISLMLR